MNEYKQFEEVIKGLRNIIKIDDTKKEIKELERKLNVIRVKDKGRRG